MNGNGAPQDDKDVSYRLGKLTEAVEGLKKSTDELRKDLQRQVIVNQKEIRELRQRMLFDVSKVATGIVILTSGFVELVKAML